jgi:membrane protease YdiL (CAAX protease family)
MNRTGISRWIWIILPVCIMLLFERVVIASINLVGKISGGIDPRLFFYIPFLSLLPPLILVLIWYLRPARIHEQKLIVTCHGTAARDVSLGVGGAVLCLAVFIGSLELQRLLSFPPPDFSSLSRVHHVFFSTAGALVPGITEEVYFRGFLMKKFSDLRPALLILVTSLSFASWHILSPSYLLHTFLVGAILGIIYHYTRRLLPVVLAHTLANALAGVLFMMGYL